MEQRTSSFICFIDAQRHFMIQGVLNEYFPEDLKISRSNGRGRVFVLDAKTYSILESQIPKDIAEVVSLPEKFGNDAGYPAVDDLFNQDRDIFFIGDMSLYAAVAASINHLYIIQVECQVDSMIKDPASIFPEELLEQWECVSSSQHSESRECPYTYSCREYTKRNL